MEHVWNQTAQVIATAHIPRKKWLLSVLSRAAAVYKHTVIMLSVTQVIVFVEGRKMFHIFNMQQHTNLSAIDKNAISA